MPVGALLCPLAQKLLHGNAHGVNIRPRIGLGKAILLRRGIAFRPQQTGIAVCTGLFLTGCVKVDQPDMPIRGQQQIGGFDIPVKNPVSMQEYQHLAQFFHQCNDLFFRQGDLRQTCTINVFL